MTTNSSKSFNAAMCTISFKSITYLVDTCMTMWFTIDSISTSSTFWKQQQIKTTTKQKQKPKKAKQNKTKQSEAKKQKQKTTTMQYITCHQHIVIEGDRDGLFIKYACMHYLQMYIVFNAYRLYFVFWPLCCVLFFDLRILITPLVCSNSSSSYILFVWNIYIALLSAASDE